MLTVCFRFASPGLASRRMTRPIMSQVPRHLRQTSTNRHLVKHDSLGQFIARNSVADATTGIDGDGENTMPI